MADNTENTQLMPPPEFVAALKSGVPEATDQQIVDSYQQIMQDPVNSALDPTTLAKAVIGAIDAHKATTAAKPAVPVAANVPSTVNTQLKSPYAGTTQEAANPQNPAASAISQFDPAQLQAAAAAQQAGYRAGLPYRGQTMFWQSQGKNGEQAITDYQKAIDDQLERETLGKQKLLQEQATSGLNAATTLQNQNKTAGEYNLSQQKGAEELAQARQKTQLGEFDVKARQDLNDPNSPQTLLAKQILLNQLKSDPSLASNPDLNALLQRGNITAQQLMAFMKPDVLEAYKTKVGIAKETAETVGKEQTNKLTAQSEGLPTPQSALPKAPAAAPAPAAPTPAAPETSKPQVINGGPNKAPTFDFAPGTDLRVIRSVMEAQPANVLAAFDKQFPGVKDATGPVYAPQNVNAQSAARVQRQGGTLTPSQAAKLPIPQNLGTPIVAALKGQPDNHDPAYIAEADDASLTPVQKLEKQALTEKDPSKVIALNRQIAEAKGEPYKAPTPLQFTGTGMARSDVTSGNASTTVNDIRATQAQLNQYNTGGQDAAKYAALHAKEGGMTGPNAITNKTNPQAQQLKIAIDKLNSDAEALGLITSGKPTGAASAIGAVGGAVSAIPGSVSKIAGPLIGSTAGLVGDTQPITVTSDPAVIQQFAYKVQLAAARKEALVAQQQAYADRHNGDSTGFIGSPVYKQIMSVKPVVNPADGSLELPLVKEQRHSLLKNGYVPLDRFLALGQE